jgi:hypothetical protein
LKFVGAEFAAADSDSLAGTRRVLHVGYKGADFIDHFVTFAGAMYASRPRWRSQAATRWAR